MEKDYSGKIPYNEMVIQSMARGKGISLEKCRKELADNIRKKDIEKLDEKYGYRSEDDDEEDKAKELIQRYREFADELKKHSDKKPEMNDLRKLIFDKPEQLKKDAKEI
jgi:hypothetical protein